VPSEDAFYIGEYVKQLIPGLQGGLKPDPYWKLIATCKHFAGYDMESTPALISIIYFPGYEDPWADARGG